MKTKHLILGLFATAFTFISCNEDEGVDFTPTVPGAYENGIIVTNEGNYQSGDASVSFVSNDLMNTENGIFTAVNGNPLGDTAQSIAFYNDLAYIVVNGSDKIEIVNKNTFETVATIDSGLENPRYMAFANEKGYVTNWGVGTDDADDFIAVIDLSTNTVTSTIPVSEGPEQIIVTNGKVYISHKGGHGVGNTLSVIASDDSLTSITVGDAPDEMVVDSANNLWVVCIGETWPSETAGKIVSIDIATDMVETTFDFATTEHPNELTIDSGNLYYEMGGAIYTMSESATTLPSTSIINTPSTTYAMEANSGNLYMTNVDYSNPAPAVLTVYDLSDNSVVSTSTVGYYAGGIYFNN